MSNNQQLWDVRLSFISVTKNLGSDCLEANNQLHRLKAVMDEKPPLR